jgi:hypothetical protein
MRQGKDHGPKSGHHGAQHHLIDNNLAVIVTAVVYCVYAISVNTGRTQDLQNIETQIQQDVSKIALDPNAKDVTDLLADLKKQNDNRNSLVGKIGYGDGNLWDMPTYDCIFPVTPDCFHRNASETNNLYLAMASGALGGCLFLLLRIRRWAIPGGFGPGASSIYALSIIVGGTIIGLLVIFLMRGTKGALLTPVSGLVQVENPYGIAFACMAAAFFSDRVLTWLSSFIDARLVTKAGATNASE